MNIRPPPALQIIDAGYATVFQMRQTNFYGQCFLRWLDTVFLKKWKFTI